MFIEAHNIPNLTGVDNKQTVNMLAVSISIFVDRTALTMTGLGRPLSAEQTEASGRPKRCPGVGPGEVGLSGEAASSWLLEPLQKGQLIRERLRLNDFG